MTESEPVLVTLVNQLQSVFVASSVVRYFKTLYTVQCYPRGLLHWTNS